LNRCIYVLKKIIIAALVIVSIALLSKLPARAEEVADIVVDSVSYNGFLYNGSLSYSIKVNNSNITALVIQLLDSEGNTVSLRTVAATLYDDNTFYGGESIRLGDGEYTLYVSDFDGKYQPAETTFTANDAFEFNAYTNISEKIQIQIEMHIPDKYTTLVIDDREYDLVDFENQQDENSSLSKLSGGDIIVYRKFIAAKEFGDKINVYLYEENETPMIGGDDAAAIISYCARDYFNQVISDGYNSEQIINLCKALDNYGYASQNLFKYKATDKALDIAGAGDLSAYKSTTSGVLPEGLRYLGSSLLLEGNTTIRHYFVGDSTGLIAAVNGDNNRVKVHQQGNYCYVDISNISAYNFDKSYELVVWTPEVSGNGLAGFRISNYSVLSYCEKVLSNPQSTSDLQTVAKALAQ